MDIKLLVFKKDDNKDFRMVQNLTMGEADFKKITRLRNQPVIAAKTFAGKENLSPAQIPTLSKDMDEQLTLAHKVVDVVDRANRKICDAVRCGQAIEFVCSIPIFEGKLEDEKFQLVVYVAYTLEEFVYLPEVMNSVFVNAIANKPICNVL